MTAYPQADFLAQLALKLRQLDLSEIQQQDLTGKAIGTGDSQRAPESVIKQEKVLSLTKSTPGRVCYRCGTNVAAVAKSKAAMPANGTARYLRAHHPTRQNDDPVMTLQQFEQHAVCYQTNDSPGQGITRLTRANRLNQPPSRK